MLAVRFNAFVAVIKFLAIVEIRLDQFRRVRGFPLTLLDNPAGIGDQRVAAAPLR